MDRQFGLIHVRIQTWFPMPIQISERARMARTEVEGQRRVLYQARQCISLDRGHGQGAALRRSIREAELAEDSQQVCPSGDFHKTRICDTPMSHCRYRPHRDLPVWHPLYFIARPVAATKVEDSAGRALSAFSPPHAPAAL